VTSYSALFNVGETLWIPTEASAAGGGVLQNVVLDAGNLAISVDIASSARSPNNDGGTFRLLLDGAIVGSHAFGPIGSFGSTVTERATLNYAGLVSASPHEIAIDIQRAANASLGTPHEYLDNIALSVTPVPEPSVFGLIACLSTFLMGK